MTLGYKILEVYPFRCILYCYYIVELWLFFFNYIVFLLNELNFLLFNNLAYQINLAIRPVASSLNYNRYYSSQMINI